MTNNHNTGDYNTGYYNTGDYNTGNCNTGDYNTGNCNTGDCNTGYYNTGDFNKGDYNTGNCNTGDFNKGDYNTGYFNSITPEYCLIFNKPAKREDWLEAKKPSWIYVRLTKWIVESDMTDKEKEAYPSYVTTGGYLKVYSSLKHAYVEAWEKATPEDRELTRQLPNFDEEVFAKIIGFNPWKKQKQTVNIGGKKYEMTDELTKALENLKEIE